MGKYFLDSEKYASLARAVAAEGCVLLKNEKQTLPLCKGAKVAVFGRIAHTYYKSGLGSGGLVNTRYVVGILDAFRNETDLVLNEQVIKLYEDWIAEHPYDEGSGWGKVPWAQEEMPVSEELLSAGADADVAVVVIGRTAGEDQDNTPEKGSYLLTDAEYELIEKVSDRFEKTAVILNVGNIIDMKWVEELHPTAVLYAWQGGQEGGNGVMDVLTGRVNPSGKLPDTIARDISDYPSAANFGGDKENVYAEDIYVGYRYFETFAKDRVLYPFGYGLSYTTFEIKAALTEGQEAKLTLNAVVTNTGKVTGKEAVQVYINLPQGRLGKPVRVLADFAKTKELAPGESQILSFAIDKNRYASYDDAGVTGHRSCYVLEEGEYGVFVGSDVRSAVCAGSVHEDLQVIEQLEEAMAPVKEFKRMKPVFGEDGSVEIAYEQAPLRTVRPDERRRERMPSELAYTGDKGYKLCDVYDKKVSMEEFVAQLDDEALIMLFRGEGMCSPKVTPGTASAFGGLTEELTHYGIPAGCCADGPSGIRMDCGTKAFSMPNGTLLGATFNLDLVKELYTFAGLELRKNRIDTLLGPGLNLHRNPLNGRNFEYISEDPLLTGKMGAVQLQAMNASGTTGTIKHFCGNNQEAHRREVNAVVSERALRELYLKCFEIAVKEGNCRSIMTSYGPVNGIWTAGNYDLNTTVLRKEWGFSGIVMTDWWAGANTEGENCEMKNRAVMVMAQNDLFMVSTNAADMDQDNVKEALADGVITRAELQRNAVNILNFLLQSPAMLYQMDAISEEELADRKTLEEGEVFAEDIVYYAQDETTGEVVVPGKDWDTKKGNSIVFGIRVAKMGMYDVTFTMKSDLGELAQLPVSVYFDNQLKMTVSVRGSEGAVLTEKRDMGMIFGSNHYIKLYFGASGLAVENIRFTLREEIKMPF